MKTAEIQDTNYNMRAAARAYHAKGFHPIPLGGDKRPLGPWAQYQDGVTLDDLEAMPWEKAQGVAGIGGIDGLVAVDFDKISDNEIVARFKKGAGLPPNYPWDVITPGGGTHVWVLCPDWTGTKIVSPGVGAAQVELRGAKHYTALPPSLHPTGGRYHFQGAPNPGACPSVGPTLLTWEALQAGFYAVVTEDAPKVVDSWADVWAQPTAGEADTPKIDEKTTAARVAGALQIVERATTGNRNNSLNKAAYILGGLVANGEIDELDAGAELMAAALSVGLPQGEAAATIDSGLNDGKASPLPPSLPNARRNGSGPGASGYSGQDTEGILSALGGASAPTFTPSQMLIGELGKLGYTFVQNELDDTIYVGDERLDDGLESSILTQMRDVFSAYDDKPAWRVSWVKDAYVKAAYENRFHPVRDYLNGLVWDGEETIARVASHFTSTDQKITYPEDGEQGGMAFDTFGVWLRKWGIGTVAKALNPSSHTQPGMLVIVGNQGDGKSTFVQWLGSPLPDLTLESPIQPDHPEHARYLSMKWIWEVAELGATTRRADVEALKGFITRTETTFRKPYGKHPIVKPCLSSFIGTVNDGVGFLNDISGNRRFLVARIGHIDWDYIKIDVNQFWAEAVAAYRKNESWNLDEIQAAHRDNLNSQHEQEDSYEGWILKYFDIDATQTDWMIGSQEIVAQLQAMGVTGGTRAIMMGVISYLKRIGLTQHWERPRRWVGIKTQDWVLNAREEAKRKEAQKAG